MLGITRSAGESVVLTAPDGSQAEVKVCRITDDRACIMVVVGGVQIPSDYMAGEVLDFSMDDYEVVIHVDWIKQGVVKLWFDADRDVEIWRKEIESASKGL